MKLEAVDMEEPEMVYVATVANVMEVIRKVLSLGIKKNYRGGFSYILMAGQNIMTFGQVQLHPMFALLVGAWQTREV